jgi:hypothetical protein
MLSEPLTVPGRAVDPYLHLDNRGLILFDGRRGVLLGGAVLGWVRETIELLIDEQRATRHRGDQFLGGWISDDGATATLYAGPPTDLVSLELPVDTLRAVLGRLGR